MRGEGRGISRGLVVKRERVIIHKIITETIQNLKLPIRLPKKLSMNRIINHLNFDKKKKEGKNNFVLLKSIGKCHITDRLTSSFIQKMIQTFQH